jgi:hypothetical protein
VLKPLSCKAGEELAGSFICMMVGPAGIGADFRVEGALEPSETAAEPDYHIGDDVIRPNAQPLAADLKRQVPVAEVPSDPQQVRSIDGLDFQKRLGGGAYK